MSIISTYNHTTRRFMSGLNLPAHTYKLMLCTAATFNATHTTLAQITRTETTQANGYITGGKALTGVAVTTVNTNGARFDADNVSWLASGGSIAAEFGILYNDTDAGDAPLAFIDFELPRLASNGTQFLVEWSASGIFNLSLVNP